MRYKVSYQCITDGAKHFSEFEFESEALPAQNDPYVLELASRDSVKFYKSGTAGLTIMSVTPANLQSI